MASIPNSTQNWDSDGGIFTGPATYTNMKRVRISLVLNVRDGSDVRLVSNLTLTLTLTLIGVGPDVRLVSGVVNLLFASTSECANRSC